MSKDYIGTVVLPDDSAETMLFYEQEAAEVFAQEGARSQKGVGHVARLIDTFDFMIDEEGVPASPLAYKYDGMSNEELASHIADISVRRNATKGHNYERLKARTLEVINYLRPGE